MHAQPSAKTGYTAGGGAAATVLIYILGTLGIELPPEVAAAAVVLVTGIIAWLVPAKSGKYVYTEPVVPESELIEGASDDLDPNDVIEIDHDPTTDTDDQPANDDEGQDGEPVADARPVDEAIADEPLPSAENEIGDDS